MASLAAFKAVLSGIVPDEQLDRVGDQRRSVQLFVGQRPIRVSLNERGALHVATMVFYTDGKADRVLDKQIAAFNAQYLFRGGYCLVVEPESLSVYLEQIVDLARFDPGTFSAHLTDFAARAAPCARWYNTLLKEEA